MKYGAVARRLEKDYPDYKKEISLKMNDDDFFIEDIDEATGEVAYKTAEQVELEIRDFLDKLAAEHDAEALFAEDKYQCIALLDEPCGICGD